jgi:flagellar basal-body rod protein FlgC
MGLFTSINTAATGLTAQRTRLDVISNNIANVDATRTKDGKVFRRSRVIFRPEEQQRFHKTPFLPKALDRGVGKGVRIERIEEDKSKQPKLKFDPTHPDAMKTGPNKGYVELPNVNVVEEMVDMISASRSYEANLTLINGSKQMFMRALEIK